MTNNIFVNAELNNDEEALISKNCHNKIVMVIYFQNKKDAVSLILKEKKDFQNPNFESITIHSEKSSFDYVKIDAKCPWWLEGKHYVLLDLENINDDITSFDVLLQPNKFSNEKTLNDFKMVLEEWHTNNNQSDTFEEWYTLCGDDIYSLYDTILVGTFAKVSDGWKFYPKLQKYEE